jgi:hypothetical protein
MIQRTIPGTRADVEQAIKMQQLLDLSPFVLLGASKSADLGPTAPEIAP